MKKLSIVLAALATIAVAPTIASAQDKPMADKGDKTNHHKMMHHHRMHMMHHHKMTMHHKKMMEKQGM